MSNKNQVFYKKDSASIRANSESELNGFSIHVKAEPWGCVRLEVKSSLGDDDTRAISKMFISIYDLNDIDNLIADLSKAKENALELRKKNLQMLHEN